MNMLRGDASTNSQRRYLYIAWRVFLCVCTLFVDEKCVFKTLGHLINAIKVKVWICFVQIYLTQNDE